jgi:hypothetical protein
VKIRFCCRKCEATVASGEVELPAAIDCPVCGERASFKRPEPAGGPLERCPACEGPHLFIQKQFPRQLGLAIVVVGAAIFLVLMGLEKILLGFSTLLAVAAVDGVIYRLSPLMTVCYHCSTEYRGVPVHPGHAGYDPKIAFYTAKQAEAGGRALLEDDLGGEGAGERNR